MDPAKGENYGVPFIEQSSNMSVASALLEHSKLKSETGNFPVGPKKLPFFIELADTNALLKCPHNDPCNCESDPLSVCEEERRQ